MHITLTATPSATWTAPAVICSGNGPFDLSTLITGDTGGTWSGTGLTGSIFDPFGLYGLQMLTYTTITGNCLDSLTQSILVSAGPMADAGPDTTVCGLSTELNAVLLTAIGAWSGNGTFAPSLNMPGAEVTVNAPGLYPFVWTVGDGQCVASDTVLITFIDSAGQVLVNAGPDQSLDVFTATTLQGEISPGATALWDVIGGSAFFDDVQDPASLVNNLSMGDNILVLTAQMGTCSAASDTVVIHVNDVFIPQGYSPNGDGVNDRFEITGLSAFPNAQLLVFNRWGQPVISSDHYANEWDGRSDNGGVLPDDTYFYVLNLTEDRTYNGYIIIKR
ncbi:MAG: gliding motility-associated C-terminal domain-containing protein [Flavobacteriales bacterium]|nr:gliding motility-associated C-terminal domain-containing protein [Flavobacteriales bacterium]